MQIRAFTPDDYDTIARIENTVYPEYPDTAEELKFYDGTREPHFHFNRFLAENSSGQALGSAKFSQSAERYHPNKFYLDIHVLPEQQRHGVGRGLLEHIMNHLETLGAITVRAQVRADYARSLDFLEAAGFVEEYRAWESRLDVQACDVTPYLHLEGQLKLEGIELKSFADLAGTPDLAQELYRLDLDACRDMPDPEPFTETSFERFQTRALQNPNFVPEAFLVAIKPDQNGKLKFLSESTLWWKKGEPDAFNGATGTRREWRGKQIALALKVKNIVWAKACGIKEIKTWNDDVNRPMLAINEKLGFVKQPAWVHYVRHFERNS
jgi:GNAT superfamily N-acetyltransferase